MLQKTKMYFLALMAVMLSIFQPAHAAVDPSVAAGVTTLLADAATLGGIVTGAVVAVMLIVLGIRLLKKMFSKAV